MNEREQFIEMIKRVVPDNGDFFRLEEDGSITLIGADEQEINFLFNGCGELKWYG